MYFQSFNPDPTKQARKVIFSKKIIPGTHSSLFLNNTLFLNNSLTEQATTQKHLGLMLDQKLTFLKHTNGKIKNMKEIRLLRKLRPILLRTSLLTIYKSFTGSHLDVVR